MLALLACLLAQVGSVDDANCVFDAQVMREVCISGNVDLEQAGSGSTVHRPELEKVKVPVGTQRPPVETSLHVKNVLIWPGVLVCVFMCVFVCTCTSCLARGCHVTDLALMESRLTRTATATGRTQVRTCWSPENFLIHRAGPGPGSWRIQQASTRFLCPRERKEELQVGAEGWDRGEGSRQDHHQDHRPGQEEAISGRADVLSGGGRPCLR